MGIVRAEDRQRVELSDGWVEIRGRLAVRDIRALAKDVDLRSIQEGRITAESMFAVLQSMVVGWSYEDEATPDNIELLDWESATVVYGAIAELIGAPPEKKGMNGATPQLEVSGTRT